jgi:hypothetical protein
MTHPLLRKVDAVTFRVPDLDSGIAFYVVGALNGLDDGVVLDVLSPLSCA